MLMKRLNNLISLMTFLFVCVAMQVNAKKPVVFSPPQYDIRCGGSGTQGYYIVEVSAVVDKASEIGEDVVLKCSVHGVLFRGFTGTGGCTSQRPLTGSAMQEQQHSEYYSAFFQNGNYSNYATMVSGSLKTSRVGKKYKVSGIVSVAKDQLRHDLEKAGMIRGLSSGF